MQRWRGAGADNVASVDYRAFLDSPEESMELILAHLFPDRRFAMALVAAAVRAEKPAPRDQMPTEFYEAVRERLAGTMRLPALSKPIPAITDVIGL